MRADELIVLATAHGIDLKHLAGNASNVFGVARKRPRTPEERRLGMPIEVTVRAAGSRSSRRHEGASAEVGQAAGGIPRIPWLAACYSIAGDTSGYAELHRALMVKELRIATDQNWPMMVTKRGGRRGYYQAELAALVLDVDRHRPMFTAAPALYALCVDVDQDIWTRSVARWFADLTLEYQRWLDISRAIIARWIRDEGEENQAA